MIKESTSDQDAKLQTDKGLVASLAFLTAIIAKLRENGHPSNSVVKVELTLHDITGMLACFGATFEQVKVRTEQHHPQEQLLRKMLDHSFSCIGGALEAAVPDVLNEVLADVTKKN